VGIVHLNAAELARRAADPRGREQFSAATGTSAVVVELGDCAATMSLVPALDLPCVVVGVVRGASPGRDLTACVDVLLAADPRVPEAVAPPAGLDRGLAGLLEAIEDSPVAATALAMLLRASPDSSVIDALASESLAYSVLQAGPEFRSRLASLRRAAPDRGGTPVTIRRDVDELVITLTRPHVHNAFNVAMRDELVEALTLALVDPTVGTVVLRGEGPSFCSGGDLSEFGTLSDPATAHVVRMTRNPGRLMALLRERLHVRLHGACIGAGVELAAFAGRVTATPDAHFVLPELSLGLIPGAGGTVSMPARIGRWRTAWLALSGARLDVDTALAWGLVDELEDAADVGSA
jgi:enoyl-CoA hydratase/carnithine racemase